MKIENGQNRKWRYRSASIGIAAIVIAAVLLINIVASAVCSGNRLFIDLTSEYIYTFSDGARYLLGNTIEQVNQARDEDDPVRVDIIFCADPDILCGNEYMRYIYYTALEMQKAFSDTVHVSTCNVLQNPSAVDAYRTNSYSNIYQSNIIVASGTEFRIYSYKAFYKSDESSGKIAVYNGEQIFLRGILAVTRAESPICALTVNHGEPFATEAGRTEYSEFLKLIQSAGYDIVYLDLEKEEIPENCRLIITFDPQTDFATDFGKGTVSEIGKLEKYLNNVYSYMVFADADTPTLPVWEEFLEDWGISFSRYTETDAESGKVEIAGTLEAVDPAHALDTAGNKIIAEYETEAPSSAVTDDMLKYGNYPKVIFENAVPVSLSSVYQLKYELEDSENETGAYTYGYYFKNGETRESYDVFRTGDTAYAFAKSNGERLTEDGKALIADTRGSYSLMRISCRSQLVNESQFLSSVNDLTYVCAVGSTSFASNEMLSTNAYGNTDVLLATFRMIGREVEPVGIDFKILYDAEADSDYYMTTVTNTDGTTTQELSLFVTASAALLIVVPGVLLAGVGIYVLVRRKTRH